MNTVKTDTLIDINFKELFIFGKGAGKDGQNTLKFENGTMSIKDHVLSFVYTSASTGSIRSAHFYLNTVSGFSYTE